ncbi:hypothetical protein [Dietzia sp. UCD-THP]|jgi:hypothetical protein|uniref:hypothetical protein n=1 Tax=Dietzia sp. UCD-THP TaxID=1292020 RepID=UPI0011BDF32A|nr:hypothetical protein [Dietzia sp. UCD-THP]
MSDAPNLTGRKPSPIGQTAKKARTSSASEAFAPSAPAAAAPKRDKGVMVYLTDAERKAFKRWAFDNDLSMSDVLAKHVAELLATEAAE